MMEFTTITLSLPELNLGNDPSVQGIEMRTDSCGTAYGT